MNSEIKCKDVMSHICESLGEELHSEKCRQIKDHLEDCPCCKSYFSSVEKTINCYKLYNIELPDEVHKNLMEKLGLSDC